MKESPDNLVSKQKARVVDLLCEGPIQGFVSGNDNYGPYKSTFLNETVLMNANNSFNFNISGDFTYSYALGNTGQAKLDGFAHVENFVPLPTNTEIKQLVQTPAQDTDYKDVVVTINNRTYPDAGTARITVKVPQLLKQTDPSQSNPEGSLEGYQIKYKIEISLNGGPYVQTGNELIVFGKTTTGYSKSIEVPLPSDGSNFLSWKIRIRRTTLNISSLKLANSLYVESVSVISTNEYSYPNSVLVAMELDSERLGGNIPSRAYEIYGLKVQVPSNYDATLRTYSGIWLGNFKPAIPQSANALSNPNFNSGTTGWIGFRSNLTTSAVSPPSGFTNYGIATVDITAGGDKSYFSFYQSPGIANSITYMVRGWYKVSNSALNFKAGINNTRAEEYVTIGNSTSWAFFETQITSAPYNGGNWIEFIAQRSGECLNGDTISLTGLEVYTPASDGKVYTNNPAWIFYDLCTNPRYGLGNYIKPEWIDKWTLYQIAQYCDGMVDDGKGGLEPRFTCNTVIAQQEDAYKVLLNLVSVFRGMLYFASGRLFPVQDALKTFVYQFTNANALDGIFNYGSSSKSTRHTVAYVKWVDPNNFYRETTEVVEDTDGITKYGYQLLEMTAFGCTSQGQAYRAGKWALVSEALETETVTFKTAIEGTYLRPGDVFQIYDNLRYNQSQGGRVNAVYSNTSIELDRDVAIQPGRNYSLTVITPRFYLEASGDITGSDQINAIRNSQVTTVPVLTTSYTGKTLTLDTGLDTSLYGPGSIWNLTLQSGDANSMLKPKQYRCLATAEYNQYEMEVLGLEYQTGKYALIETGFSIINNQVYADTPTAPPVPGGFSDGTYQRLGVNYTTGDQGYFRDYLQLDWFPVESSILKFYRVRLTPPGGSAAVITDTVSDTYAHALSGCRPTGQYLFSVTSVGKNLSESTALTGGYTITLNNGIGSLSYGTTSPITGLYAWPYDASYLPSGFESRTPSINVLRNTGTFDGNDPRFFFVTGYGFQLLDTGTAAVILDLGTVAREYVNLTSANINTIGNRRTFDVKVTPFTCIGAGINGFSALTQRFTNIPPLPAAYTSYSSASNGINYNIGPNINDTDISGVYLWTALTSAGFTPSFGNQTLTSDNTVGVHPLAVTGNYNVWYSLIDSYGTGGCIINGPTVASYSGVNINPGSITASSFATGIAPITIVGALPASGTTGQVVFLTTDSKLYRWNGAAWTTVVNNADLAAGSVGNAQIQSNAVGAGELQNNAVTRQKILDGAIDTLKIAQSGISGAALSDNCITASTIAAGSIIAGKIASNAVTAGTIAANAVTAGTISANAVTAGSVSANAISGLNIVGNSIQGYQIVAATITGGNITAGTIRGINIAANTITGDNLVVGTIRGAFIAANTISGNNLIGNTITASQIAAGTITANEIAANTITAAKMSVTDLSAISANIGTITAGSITVTGDYYDGSVFKTASLQQGAFIVVPDKTIPSFPVTRVKVNGAAGTNIQMAGGALVDAFFSTTDNVGGDAVVIGTNIKSTFNKGIVTTGITGKGPAIFQNSGGTSYFEVAAAAAVDVIGVNFRILDSGRTQKFRVDNTNGNVYIQNVRILTTQQATPVTLADVIAAGQAHGLWA